MLERQAKGGRKTFRGLRRHCSVCSECGQGVVPYEGNGGRAAKCGAVVPGQWAALPSGMGLWASEGSENCLAKGDQGKESWGTPLRWGGLSWETVWGPEAPLP